VKKKIENQKLMQQVQNHTPRIGKLSTLESSQSLKLIIPHNLIRAKGPQGKLIPPPSKLRLLSQERIEEAQKESPTSIGTSPFKERKQAF
jgi:hypothetical protein